MCQNIKTLYNFEPPATDDEIRAAAQQFVRKVTGFHHPSRANEVAFEQAVDAVATTTKTLFSLLTTDAKPHDREVEAEWAHERALKRFGPHTH